jgi:hypothetical protein
MIALYKDIMPAPVALFVFNRLEHTKATIDALQQNCLAEKTDLYVFSDAPRHYSEWNKIRAVREYLQTLKAGFNTISVIEREWNWGIEDSVKNSIPELCNKHGKVIVLEEDLQTSPFFLKFMNEALDFYATDPAVCTITGFNFPKSLMNIPENYHKDVYFYHRTCSSGWATWANKIKLVDWNVDFNELLHNKQSIKKLTVCGDDFLDVIRSYKDAVHKPWDVLLSIHQCLNNYVTVFPVYSYIHNIGFDNTGLHSPATNKFDNDLSKAIQETRFVYFKNVENKIKHNFKRIFKYTIKVRFKSIFKLWFDYLGYKLIKL